MLILVKLTNMRKVSCSLVLSALLASSTFAEGFQTNTLDVKIGQQSISNESALSYSLGYIAAMTFKNNVYFGVGFDLQYARFSNDTDAFNSISFFTDMLLGYETDIGLTPYLLGGVVYANIEGTHTEFGYGAGVRYAFNENWSVGAEYRKYTTAFDNSIINGFLSYSWAR